jgi:phosphate transport system substrate-binding protein
MEPLLFVFGVLFIVIGLWQFFLQRRWIAIAFSGLGIICILLAYLSFPKEDKRIAQKTINIRVVGSKTIGSHLMPDLVVDFLDATGYELIDKNESPDKVIYIASSKEKNILLTIEIKASGSFFGFEALATDACEISMSSDQIDSLVLTKLGRRFNPKHHEHVIAYDAIQIIVHPIVGNRLGLISKEKLQLLLTGKLYDWSELHPDLKGPIKTVLRDASSGSYHFMKESLFPNDSLRADAIRFAYFEKISAFVEQDSMAIGFVNYALDSIHLQNVTVIGIVSDSGTVVKPTLQSIQNNSYPLSRKLYLYNSTRTDQDPMVQALLRFCKSPAAIEEVRRDGLVPVLE